MPSARPAPTVTLTSSRGSLFPAALLGGVATDIGLSNNLVAHTRRISDASLAPDKARA